MTINVERDFELVTLGITGRLDTTTAPNLEAVISELSEDIKELVFDVSGVEYISSAGLRVLLIMQNDCEDGVIMKSCNESVIEVLSNTHIKNK